MGKPGEIQGRKATELTCQPDARARGCYVRRVAHEQSRGNPVTQSRGAKEPAWHLPGGRYAGRAAWAKLEKSSDAKPRN